MVYEGKLHRTFYCCYNLSNILKLLYIKEVHYKMFTMENGIYSMYICLQGHSKEFHYIMANVDESFAVHFNHVTLIHKHNEIHINFKNAVKHFFLWNMECNAFILYLENIQKHSFTNCPTKKNYLRRTIILHLLYCTEILNTLLYLKYYL